MQSCCWGTIWQEETLSQWAPILSSPTTLGTSACPCIWTCQYSLRKKSLLSKTAKKFSKHLNFQTKWNIERNFWKEKQQWLWSSFPPAPTKEDTVMVQRACELLTMHWQFITELIQQGTPIKQAVGKPETWLAPKQQQGWGYSVRAGIQMCSPLHLHYPLTQAHRAAQGRSSCRDLLQTQTQLPPEISKAHRSAEPYWGLWPLLYLAAIAFLVEIKH